MALGLLPAFALAANDEDVLASIKHNSAIGTVTLAAGKRNVTLTVPFGYDSGTLDLSEGLDVTPNSGYTVVAPSFPGDNSVAGVDGSDIPMTVTYQKVGDAESTYTTQYQISVKRKALVKPMFSGTVSKSLVAPGSASFLKGDFTGLYTQNDGDDLAFVSITGVTPSYGGLKLNSDDYELGSLIPLNDLGKLSFVADAAPETGKTVSYSVSAYTGDSEDKKVDGGAFLSISVGVVSVPTITKAVTKSVNSGSTVTFSLSDFSSCYNLNNGTLKNIIVTPVGSVGTWYNGSSVITAATSFTSATIGNLKYKGSVSGNGSFKWTVSNDAGTSAEGTGTVTVSTSVADVTYTVGKGVTAVFDDSHFTSVSNAAGFGTLNYIIIGDIPSTSAGALYVNYTSDSSKGTKPTAAVLKTTKIYRSSLNTPYIDKVAFVPASSYTGTFTLPYTGYDAAGNSYSGNIKITVRTMSAYTLEYETFENETVVLKGSDFNSACRDLGLRTLDYIQFTALPNSSNRGTLYYNYASDDSLGTSVKTATKLYYRSSDTLDLNKVAFKPYKNYSGTVNVNYTGRDLDGVQFEGTVSFVIEEDYSDVDPVTYTTAVNQTLRLDGDDFNDVCEDEGYEELNYITLSAQPNSDKGVFYYNYSSSSSPGTKPSASTKLYYDSNDKYDLDKVAFIPAKNYEGSFIVAYNGVDVDGDRFVGQIKVTVSEGEATLKDVTYITATSTPLTLVTDDFNKVCKNETGYNLSYIQFTLPGSAYGKLYTAYNTTTGKGTAVTASTKYYRSTTPRIDTVSFVPATAYTGVVTVNYTGEDTDGTLVSGKLLITVLKDNGASSRYFEDVGTGHAWAGKQIDYLYEEGIVKGTGGKSFSPGSNIIRGDFVLMLHRSVKFSSTSSSNFGDVPKSSYYYDAIAAAKASGIAEGDNGNFYPNKTLTRQDAMVLVYRALNNAGYGLSNGTSSNLTSFSDRGSISSYATTAVATLVKAGVVEGNAGKINPLGNITRAEMSVILYRVLNLD